jgi:PilZ domain
MERRRYPRGKSFYGGVIAFNARQSTIDCVVRNFSSAGARIAMSGTVLLPDEFDLTIARKEASFRARLVWRDGCEAGLQFTTDDDQRVVSLDVSRKLQKRRAEIERLKRRVAELTDGQ